MKAAELMGWLMNDEAILLFAQHGQIVGLFGERRQNCTSNEDKCHMNLNTLRYLSSNY